MRMSDASRWAKLAERTQPLLGDEMGRILY